MDKIKFKGKSNMDYSNLFIHDIGLKKKPEERVILHDNIPGSSGTKVEHTGVFNAYERIIVLYDRYGENDLRDWLTGSGKLELSTEPRGFYKASIIEEYAYQTIKGTSVKYIEVPFLIQPFFYLKRGQFSNLVEYEGKFLNNYSVPAKPLIKILGTGNLQFYFNNDLITVNNVRDFVMIDSETFQVYDNERLRGKDMIGNFPVLSEKENVFRTVNCKLEVTPRWCSI